jgi:DNA-binding NtrC family response regulator
MATSSNSCGGSFLARRSSLVKARAETNDAPPEVLVIEDESIDAEHLLATLRILFGYDHEIRWTSTLGDAVNRVIERTPDIVFLDDALKPSSDASQTIPLLRGAGFSGPVIVICGQITHARRAHLLASGACDVIDKDDVDSVRVGEAVALSQTQSVNGQSDS